jgi:thiosulfate/3-mercaptopyruvate sulfurtransferase
MFGHKDVRVLDGGLPAWIKAGQAVTASPVVYPRSKYTATSARSAKAALADVLRAQGSAQPNNVQIVDARPSGRFYGTAPEPRRGLASGHMPGAINVPFGSLRTDDKSFKPLSEIAQLFNGVDIFAPIITSCGSGITAAGLAFQLARLGAKNIAVYDGSWSEYGAKVNLPIQGPIEAKT